MLGLLDEYELFIPKVVLISRIYGKMEIKGLKENEQVKEKNEKTKLKHWKIAQGLLKQV